MSPVTAVPEERRHRLSVADFHQLAEAGAFGSEERVELIGGELFDMTPIGSRHAAAVDRLVEKLVIALQGGYQVHIQNPIRLGEDSEPQPDVALLRRREDGYAHQLPAAEDVRVVVEVADTSLTFDRDVKLPLYARHAIPEAWLVDLEADRVEVHSAPFEGEYGRVDRYRAGMTLESGAAGVRLAVEEILPPA